MVGKAGVAENSQNKPGLRQGKETGHRPAPTLQGSKPSLHFLLCPASSRVHLTTVHRMALALDPKSSKYQMLTTPLLNHVCKLEVKTRLPQEASG